MKQLTDEYDLESPIWKINKRRARGDSNPGSPAWKSMSTRAPSTSLRFMLMLNILITMGLIPSINSLGGLDQVEHKIRLSDQTKVYSPQTNT